LGIRPVELEVYNIPSDLGGARMLNTDLKNVGTWLQQSFNELTSSEFREEAKLTPDLRAKLDDIRVIVETTPPEEWNFVRGFVKGGNQGISLTITEDKNSYVIGLYKQSSSNVHKPRRDVYFIELYKQGDPFPAFSLQDSTIARGIYHDIKKRSPFPPEQYEMRYENVGKVRPDGSVVYEVREKKKAPWSKLLDRFI
jgi:hypothetical protein